jgi:hypothetical protein
MFRGVNYTIEPEPGGLWCWHRDDGAGGVQGGFTSEEAAATDARLAINERVSRGGDGDRAA